MTGALAPGPSDDIVAGVRYRFGEHALDLARRELRRGPHVLPVQPQTFALLAFLLEHRERVVSKRELMDAMWPDVVVTEGSLQRAVSLARKALGPEGRHLIRTHARHGYRFVGEVAVDGARVGAGDPSGVRPMPGQAPIRPRYAPGPDAHIAYHTLGEGDLDIVYVPGWSVPMQCLFTLEEPSALIHGLAELGRVVLFDKRGTGMSDRVKELPSLEQRMDDLRLVLDEVASERAIVVGVSEGGPLSIAFAAQHPDRVAGLVLVGAFPRMAAARDYPHGWKPSEVAALRAYVRRRWGEGATFTVTASHRADDPDVAAWACSCETDGASPGAASDLLEMNLRIDVRDRLGRVRVPTVVLHASEDPVVRVGNGRFLAEHIPEARYVEVEGTDHTFMFTERARLLGEVRCLVERAQR